jgi:hypothetical protein
MFWLIALGWIGVGIAVAWLLNNSFDLGGPVDPGASGSRILPKWAILLAIVVLWPFAIFLPLIAVISWMRSGSH